MYIKFLIYFDRRKLSEYSNESVYNNKRFHDKAIWYSPMSTSNEWFMTARPISAYKFMIDEDGENDEE